MTFLPPQKYAGYLYEYYTGKKLNLNNPVEFNEKIQWLKVYYHPQILNQLVDKYAVRTYVEEKIGAQYLNEAYGVYESANEVDFNKLPNQFVIKATHASSYNLIVSDKTKLVEAKARKLFKKWLNKNQYFRTGQEWAYKDVQPRLIAEKYLKEAGQGSLIDYKFYCFHGIAKFVEVHLERTKDYKRGFFDLDFKKLPFNKGETEHAISEAVKKPDNFDELIFLANKLAEKLPFVRVDFYSVNGKAIFGEMTFYPADGRKDFYPEEYNKIIGDYFILPEIPKGQKHITVI
jgi:hypothetical protein